MRALALLAAALAMVAGCSESPAPDDELQPLRSTDVPRVVPAREALAGAHIPTVDAATMNDAEISKVLGAGAFCAFRYTSTGRPVLAFKPLVNAPAAAAVVKLNGFLVPLQHQGEGALSWGADEVHVELSIVEAGEDAARAGNPRPRVADLLFEITGQLRVGYRGYYVCAA